MAGQQGGFLDAFERHLEKRLPEVGDALATRLGDPPRSSSMSASEEDRAWSHSEGIDLDARATAILEQVLTEMPLDPSRADHAEKLVAEVAARLTDEEHPYRRDVYTIATVSKAEMAEKAERVKQRVEGKRQAPPDATPEPAPESAPTGEGY